MQAREIIEAVCEVADVSFETMMGRRRAQSIARPRQLCCYLLRDMTKLSMPAIGRKLGRDHTTVLHGIRQATKLLETNQEFRDLHTKVMENISNIVSRETQVGA